MSGDTLDWHYGPTSTHPDPGRMWHTGCGGEVVSSDGGLICACGQQENSDDHDDHDGPFRVGRSWGVTVVYDPTYDPDATTKTGVLWSTAQTPAMANQIVEALNYAHANGHTTNPDSVQPAQERWTVGAPRPANLTHITDIHGRDWVLSGTDTWVPVPRRTIPPETADVELPWSELVKLRGPVTRKKTALAQKQDRP
jgi:hypothetical protein